MLTELARETGPTKTSRAREESRGLCGRRNPVCVHARALLSSYRVNEQQSLCLVHVAHTVRPRSPVGSSTFSATIR